nr:MAG TPA_asm: hypothetical protein [Bacteriophage sp.]
MWNNVPKQVRERIKKIQSSMSLIRKKAKDQNPRLKKLSKERQALYEKYLDSVKTEVYK